MTHGLGITSSAMSAAVQTPEGKPASNGSGFSSALTEFDVGGAVKELEAQLQASAAQIKQDIANLETELGLLMDQTSVQMGKGNTQFTSDNANPPTAHDTAVLIKDNDSAEIATAHSPLAAAIYSYQLAQVMSAKGDIDQIF